MRKKGQDYDDSEVDQLIDWESATLQVESLGFKHTFDQQLPRKKSRVDMIVI